MPPCVKRGSGVRTLNTWSLRKVHQKRITLGSNHRVHAYQDEKEANHWAIWRCNYRIQFMTNQLRIRKAKQNQCWRLNLKEVSFPLTGKPSLPMRGGRRLHHSLLQLCFPHLVIGKHHLGLCLHIFTMAAILTAGKELLLNFTSGTILTLKPIPLAKALASFRFALSLYN